jgi:hypothetical protein
VLQLISDYVRIWLMALELENVKRNFLLYMTTMPYIIIIIIKICRHFSATAEGFNITLFPQDVTFGPVFASVVITDISSA